MKEGKEMTGEKKKARTITLKEHVNEWEYTSESIYDDTERVRDRNRFVIIPLKNEKGGHLEMVRVTRHLAFENGEELLQHIQEIIERNEKNEEPIVMIFATMYEG